MKLIDHINRNIDHENDGILFTMTIFSEGKFDKSQFRTVVRNVGIKVTIENELYVPFSITNFYLGIAKENKLVKLYYSNSLSSQFSKPLYPGEVLDIYFYGWDIKEKFQEFENEKGMFVIASNDETKHSSKFDGDTMENDIVYLEDGEIANWGNKKYHLFDIETTL